MAEIATETFRKNIDNLHYEKFADGSVKCIEDEIPFELPEGWAWTRLGSLIELFITGPFGSALHKSDYVTDGIPLINPMNIIDGKVVPIDKMQVSPETVERLSSFKVAPNDIVIARRGDMGRCAVVQPEQEGWLCGTGSFVLRFPAALCSEYFAVCLRSPYSVEYLSGNSIGNTMLNLNQAILKSILLPVPPCTEQNRIINAIFDADIHLAEITNQREALVMYVAKAKAKILDLAIRGQLVPQDPTDEPAFVLLERIRAEKEELIRQGKIKRDKKESVIFRGEDNSYYEKISEKVSEYDVDELPYGWSVGSLSQVNMFASEAIDPSNSPDEMFELYSVPNFEVGVPEIIRGKEIGSSKQAICENDVLVCKINPRINRVWITGHITSYRLLGSSEWIVFRNHLLFAPYLRYYFSSPYFRELILSNVSGVGGSLMRAQPESVKKYPVLIPPYQEQLRIAERIDELFTLLVAIEKSLN